MLLSAFEARGPPARDREGEWSYSPASRLRSLGSGEDLRKRASRQHTGEENPAEVLVRLSRTNRRRARRHSAMRAGC